MHEYVSESSEMGPVIEFIGKYVRYIEFSTYVYELYLIEEKHSQMQFSWRLRCFISFVVSYFYQSMQLWLL